MGFAADGVYGQDGENFTLLLTKQNWAVKSSWSVIGMFGCLLPAPERPLIMQFRATGNVRRTGGWRRVLGAALAVMILPAVPAAATITFNLGGWTFKQNQDPKGGPPNTPPPAVGASAVDFPVPGHGTGTSVTLDFGMFTAPVKKSGKSEILATRFFTVSGAGGEMIKLIHSFITQLTESTSSGVRGRAALEVDAKVEHMDKIRIRRKHEFRGTSMIPHTVGTSPTESSMALLKPGKYKLEIKIKYEADKSGKWNNISPHRFTLKGV